MWEHTSFPLFKVFLQLIPLNKQVLKKNDTMVDNPEVCLWVNGRTNWCVTIQHRVEWALSTGSLIDEPQNNYAEGKKPDKRNSISYGSIYIKFYKIKWQISRSVEVDRDRERIKTGRRTRGSSGCVRCLGCDDFTGVCMYHSLSNRTLQLRTVRPVTYTAIKLF